MQYQQAAAGANCFGSEIHNLLPVIKGRELEVIDLDSLEVLALFRKLDKRPFIDCVRVLKVLDYERLDALDLAHVSPNVRKDRAHHLGR